MHSIMIPRSVIRRIAILEDSIAVSVHDCWRGRCHSGSERRSNRIRTFCDKKLSTSEDSGRTTFTLIIIFVTSFVIVVGVVVIVASSFSSFFIVGVSVVRDVFERGYSADELAVVARTIGEDEDSNFFTDFFDFLFFFSCLLGGAILFFVQYSRLIASNK